MMRKKGSNIWQDRKMQIAIFGMSDEQAIVSIMGSGLGRGAMNTTRV